MSERDEQKRPVIALEFWDKEGNLVIAHFMPDGEVDARVANETTSGELKGLRGRSVAQVSLEVSEGVYRRVGEIESWEAHIEELVMEFMSMPIATYEQLTEFLPEDNTDATPKQTLH